MATNAKVKTPKMSKEEFEAQREKMKEDARILVDTNGSYGTMDRIYGFMLLDLESSALIFSPKKDPRARIGAIVINNELFMAGPTTCRTAGEYIVECFQDLQEKLYPSSDTTQEQKPDENKKEPMEKQSPTKKVKMKKVSAEKAPHAEGKPLSTSIGDSISQEDMKKLQDMAAENNAQQVSVEVPATATVVAAEAQTTTMAQTAVASVVVPNSEGGVDIVTSIDHDHQPINIDPNQEWPKAIAQESAEAVAKIDRVEDLNLNPGTTVNQADVKVFKVSNPSQATATYSAPVEQVTKMVPNADGTGVIPDQQ